MNVRFDPIRKSIIIKNNYNYTYLIICTCTCVCKVSNFHKNIALKIFQNSISILDTTLLILSVHSNGFSENLLIIEMQSSKSSLFSALHKFEIFPAFLFHCLSCVSVSVSIYFCLLVSRVGGTLGAGALPLLSLSLSLSPPTTYFSPNVSRSLYLLVCLFFVACFGVVIVLGA